ncbi:hypothetical protein J3B02_002263 [Coemansia erecta]|nr:hypothetical protein J3B02_002263 [Coemansia erecta]
MSDVGYFYADVFGLVRPTVDAVKGINCVDGIDSNILLPEVLDALTRVNAGHEPKTQDPAKTCSRFGVVPSQTLLKGVFPWIRPLLLKAYGESDNNKDVRSATRLLRLLRELRVVVLQDVALMMQLPSLESAIKTNKLFSHSIFVSDEFAKFREEMRMAFDEEELKDLDKSLSTALRRTFEYKEKYPQGNEKRKEPTAPRFDISKLQARRNESESTAADIDGNVQKHERPRQLERNPSGPAGIVGPSSPFAGSVNDAGHKRPLTPTQSNGESCSISREHSIDIVGSGSKRQRRVYDTIVNSQPIASLTEPAGSSANGLHSRPGMSSVIDELRIENEELKGKLQRLEYTFGQHRSEMRSWMGKMENIVHSIVSAPSRPPSPPLEAGQHGFRQYGGQRQPVPSSMSGQGPLHVPSKHPSQHAQVAGSSYMVRPQRAYADTRYYQSSAQTKQAPVQLNGHQSPPLPTNQESMNDYDRMSLNNDGASDVRPPMMPQGRQRGYMPAMQPTMRASGIQQPSHHSEVNGSGSVMQTSRRMPNSQYMSSAEYGEYRRSSRLQAPMNQSHQQQQQQMHPGYSHEQMYPGKHGPY